MRSSWRIRGKWKRPSNRSLSNKRGKQHRQRLKKRGAHWKPKSNWATKRLPGKLSDKLQRLKEPLKKLKESGSNKKGFCENKKISRPKCNFKESLKKPAETRRRANSKPSKRSTKKNWRNNKNRIKSENCKV